MTFTQQLVIAVLSGGGAAAIFTLVKAVLAVRTSVDTREATAIGNLERWRRDADARADRAYHELGFERETSAYWQRRAASAEHLLLMHGHQPPDCGEPPKMMGVETG